MEPAELGGLAEELAAQPELWRPFVRHDAGERVFTEIHRDHHIDAWLICWSGGQETGLHDHDLSGGAVRVIDGSLAEDRLVFGRTGVETVTYGPGERFLFDSSRIHDVRHVGEVPRCRCTCTRRRCGGWGTTTSRRTAASRAGRPATRRNSSSSRFRPLPIVLICMRRAAVTMVMVAVLASGGARRRWRRVLGGARSDHRHDRKAAVRRRRAGGAQVPDAAGGERRPHRAAQRRRHVALAGPADARQAPLLAPAHPDRPAQADPRRRTARTEPGTTGVLVTMSARLKPAPLSQWVQLGRRVITARWADGGWRSWRRRDGTQGRQGEAGRACPCFPSRACCRASIRQRRVGGGRGGEDGARDPVRRGRLHAGPRLTPTPATTPRRAPGDLPRARPQAGRAVVRRQNFRKEVPHGFVLNGDCVHRVDPQWGAGDDVERDSTIGA